MATEPHACISPDHWVDSEVGLTEHDGGLPEDPRTPCRFPGEPEAIEARRTHTTHGVCDDTIEALRSRVAAQDAEIARLRGLVGRLADVVDRKTATFEPRTWDLLAEARAEVPR
jgi:hypothetical protein